MPIVNAMYHSRLCPMYHCLSAIHPGSMSYSQWSRSDANAISLGKVLRAVSRVQKVCQAACNVQRQWPYQPGVCGGWGWCMFPPCVTDWLQQSSHHPGNTQWQSDIEISHRWQHYYGLSSIILNAYISNWKLKFTVHRSWFPRYTCTAVFKVAIFGQSQRLVICKSINRFRDQSQVTENKYLSR